MNRFPIICSLSLLTIILTITLFSQNEKKEKADVEFLYDQKIRMSDGVQISASIWKPVEKKEPLPAILTMTPYIVDRGHKDGEIFARRGYIIVRTDVRGRGNSGGEFLYHENDSRDGAEIVDWIAKQPWCNGQVAMKGGSYGGAVQWQVLKQRPPALKTIIPAASAHPGIDFPQPHNIFYSYFARYLALISGKTANFNLFGDTRFWNGKYYKLYKEHMPFSKLAEISGSNEKLFKRYIAHPSFDEFWQAISPTDKDYNAFNIPILSITGYFDSDQLGAMHYYNEHMKHGNPEGKQKHILLIGPWGHRGTRYPTKDLYGLHFGEKSVPYKDLAELHIQWFDWILKGKERPGFLKNRVCYYVMNADEWKYTNKIENIANEKSTWFLSSENGMANDVFQSGSLEMVPSHEKQKPDVFEYDPLDIIESASFDDALGSESEYYTNQRFAFGKDKLIYHSPQLEEELEVAGYAKLRLYMELNVPDTDFEVGLFEIKPDGKSILLGTSHMRARYRNSVSKAELVTPGDINLYEFKKFDFFVRKLSKGSRIRLVIGCINSPEWEKNYNSGGVVSEETAKDARKAIIKVHHDKEHPSALELAVYKGGSS
ncbi:CocE/NonD family hydrolase [Acidobacteriota bacterium]